MKKKMLCSLLLCLLILSSCAGEEPSGTHETDFSPSESAQAIETEESETETNAPETEETEPEESKSEETEPEPVYITEEEISALMESYLNYEMYTQYDTDAIIGAPPAETDENGLVAEIEMTSEYSKVYNEKYDTWDEWIAFIESIYCGDRLTEELEYMENNSRFVNIDGYTHVRAGGMGWYISGDYTYEILRSNENCALLEIMRTEIEPGELERQERHWFYYLNNTENGWRISDILNFD